MSEEKVRWKKCRNCKFAEIEKTWTHCHKRSPMPSPDDGSSWWPAIELDSPKAWCGDWEKPEGTLETLLAEDEFRRLGVVPQYGDLP